MHNDHKLKIIPLLIGDFVLMYAALTAVLLLRYYNTPGLYLVDLHIIPFSIVFFVWIVFFGAFGLYDLRLLKNSRGFLLRLVRAMITNVILAILIFYLIPSFEIEPRRNLFGIAAASTVFIFTWRSFFNWFIKTPASHVLFFGINPETIALADYLLKNPQLGQKSVGFVEQEKKQLPQLYQLPVFVFEQDFKGVIGETEADTIVIASEMKENKTLVKILFGILPLGVKIIEFPDFHEMLTGKIPLSLIGEVWFLENLIGSRKNFYEFFKRVFDIISASIAGVASLLISPLIILAIELQSPGPVFFRQKRVGRNGKIFELLKFRSTHRTEVAHTEGWEKEEDAIYTSAGRFLRASYLDELPQLINIFRGEMSFVGPRPERPEFVKKLKQEIPFYEMRLLVSPGITGWAQINMENDAAAKDAPEKTQYDLYYIKNRSFILDLLILLRTFFTVIRRTGR